MTYGYNQLTYTLIALFITDNVKVMG